MNISQQRLKEIASIPDEKIDTSDIPELDDDFWKDARFIIPESKKVREMAMTSAQALKKEGKKEGREEGREEGRKEGALLERQEAILEAINARFQTIPSPLPERIKTIKSMARLKRIFNQCLIVDSLDEIDI